MVFLFRDLKSRTSNDTLAGMALSAASIVGGVFAVPIGTRMNSEIICLTSTPNYTSPVFLWHVEPGKAIYQGNSQADEFLPWVQ
jgi:hypothetical protein